MLSWSTPLPRRMRAASPCCSEAMAIKMCSTPTELVLQPVCLGRCGVHEAGYARRGEYLRSLLGDLGRLLQNQLHLLFHQLIVYAQTFSISLARLSF